MKRDEAREHFNCSKLTYANLTLGDIFILMGILSNELSSYMEYGGDHAQQMAMRLHTPKVKDIKGSVNGLKYAYIKISGSYFKEREGISFNENGRIGFGGELSDVNTEPVLKAFCQWCDTLTSQKGGTKL